MTATGPTISSLFLVCRDLVHSVQFYQQLGFSKLKEGNRSAVFVMGDSGAPELHLHAELSLAEQADYQVAWQQGSSGIVLSFEVPDLEALVQRARPENLLVAPRETPWGARIAMLIDPDGYRLEFRQGRIFD